MRHREVEDSFLDLLEGSLDKAVEKELREHLSVCGPCSSAFKQYRSLVELEKLIARSPSEEVLNDPASLMKVIRQQDSLAKKAFPALREFFSPRASAWIGAAAAVCLALVLCAKHLGDSKRLFFFESTISREAVTAPPVPVDREVTFLSDQVQVVTDQAHLNAFSGRDQTLKSKQPEARRETAAVFEDRLAVSRIPSARMPDDERDKSAEEPRLGFEKTLNAVHGSASRSGSRAIPEVSTSGGRASDADAIDAEKPVAESVSGGVPISKGDLKRSRSAAVAGVEPEEKSLRLLEGRAEDKAKSFLPEPQTASNGTLVPFDTLLRKNASRFRECFYQGSNALPREESRLVITMQVGVDGQPIHAEISGRSGEFLPFSVEECLLLKIKKLRRGGTAGDPGRIYVVRLRFDPLGNLISP